MHSISNARSPECGQSSRSFASVSHVGGGCRWNMNAEDAAAFAAAQQAMAAEAARDAAAAGPAPDGLQ